jgi:hypothetical protein
MKRPSHGRAQKSSQTKSDKEERKATVQNGEVTADRVVENIKKRKALKESGAEARNKEARVERLEIHVSDDEDEEDGEEGADRPE